MTDEILAKLIDHVRETADARLTATREELKQLRIERAKARLMASMDTQPR